MTITYQETVAADSSYSFVNDPSNILFDLHNDTPWNVGMSFGNDTGMNNADYFAPPHSMVQGIPAPGTSNQNKYSMRVNPSYVGTIYLYTQTPQGGAGIDTTTAPALQITVVAYNPGLSPQGYTALNRMTNTGNTVPISSSATTLSNHSDASGTKIISITDSGDPSGDTFSVDNLGNVQVGNGQNSGVINTGELFAGTQSSLNFHVDTAARVHTRQIDLGGGSLAMVSFFSGTCGTSLTTFTHGLKDMTGAAAIPDYIFITLTGTGSTAATIRYDPTTLTSTQAKLIASAASTAFVAIAIKQTF